jgi:PAS domain S-box-containing protein
MPLAEMEAGSWLGAVAILISVVTAGGAVVIAYFGNARTTLERLNSLQKQVFSQQDEIGKLRTAGEDCLRRETDALRRESDLKQQAGEQKAELVALYARVRSLEAVTGSVPPPPLAGILVADLNGVIVEYSPALVPVLEYLPEEAKGKRVEELIPEPLREAHRASFRGHAANPDTIDPAREELTYMLSKSGARVPVAMTLRGWRTGHEGLITATIRQRVPGGTTKLGGQP